MLTAHFIGDHASDTWTAQVGCALTKLGQKGPYGGVTHTEAIHKLHSDGRVTIASSSLRDGGVRDKSVLLNPLHWMIVDVPRWDVEQSVELLEETRGSLYDLRGAVATLLPGAPTAGRFFCNHWVGQPFIKASATFGPHQFCAICLSLGQDVTEGFFAERSALQF